MFDPFFEGLAWLMAFFYDLFDELVGTNAYAIAIVMLTLSIMIAFTPLTIKGTRSMMQMSNLQPEIKRIQAQHRGDRQKINEEMMKLYQTHGVSPLGGCLPTLIQIPVFFVLYRVVNGLTSRPDPESNFEPSYLDQNSQIYNDLTATNEMRSFGMDLARSANEVLRDSFIDALPYLALVLLTFGLAWFQQRQLRARRAGAVSTNKQMEFLTKVLPYMLPLFAFLVQSALAIYFVASSVYRIGQQAFIHRTISQSQTDAAGAGQGGGQGADRSGRRGGRGLRGLLGRRGSRNGAVGGTVDRNVIDVTSTSSTNNSDTTSDRSGNGAGGSASNGEGEAAAGTNGAVGGSSTADGLTESTGAPAAVPMENVRSQKALSAEQRRLEERAARSTARRAAGSAGGPTSQIGTARQPKSGGAGRAKPGTAGSDRTKSGTKSKSSKGGGAQSGTKSGTASSDGSKSGGSNGGGSDGGNSAATAPSTSQAESGSHETGGASPDETDGSSTDATGTSAGGLNGTAPKSGLLARFTRNRGGASSNGNSNGKTNGRANGKANNKNDTGPKPIQSRRTSGDGKTRKRR